MTSPFCDSNEGKCKCSSEVESCSLGKICLEGRCEYEPPCANPEETSVGGVCKCGRSSSCVGSSTAPFCDASNGICKCSTNVDACTNGEKCKEGLCRCGTADSCVGSAVAPYCDDFDSICKCSPFEDACSVPGETCAQISSSSSFNECQCGSAPTCKDSSTAPFCDASNDICKCSSSVDACNHPGEICVDGICKCGTAASCKDDVTAPFCDQNNNVCKCSSTVDSCKNLGEICENDQCKCGKMDSCASSTGAPYCNAEASVCKCSESTDACDQLNGQTCSNGLCKTLGKSWMDMIKRVMAHIKYNFIKSNITHFFVFEFQDSLTRLHWKMDIVDSTGWLNPQYRLKPLWVDTNFVLA